MEKVQLFGFDFWNSVSEFEVAKTILSNTFLYKDDNIEFLITPNAYDIAQYHFKYKELHQKFKNAAVVLADGMPIVWLSRIRGNGLKKRITGSNFFPVLWKQIIENNKKAYFILPNQKMADIFFYEYKNCKAAIPNFFDHNDDEYIDSFVEQHIEEINSFKPDFIFIGLTIPKQQKIALSLYRHLSGRTDFNCMIAILGASYEFYLGLKKRAPLFYQRSGTEWLYRLAQEPKRLWKRYTIGNLQFLYIAFKEVFKKRGRKFWR